MIAGFILGLISSLHCAAMCGPLHLAIPFGSKGGRNRILLQLGRITTYSLLGVIPAFIGLGFYSLGMQKWLVIVSGVSLIVLAFGYKRWFKPNGKAANWLKNRLLAVVGNRNGWRYYSMGLANGMLPCGMVYFALISAANFGGFSAVLFMLLFGLGTLPMLIGVSYLGKALSRIMKVKLVVKQKYVLLTLGLLLTFRGLGLGIPFLSPAYPVMNATVKASTESGTIKVCQ